MQTLLAGAVEQSNVVSTGYWVTVKTGDELKVKAFVPALTTTSPVCVNGTTKNCTEFVDEFSITASTPPIETEVIEDKSRPVPVKVTRVPTGPELGENVSAVGQACVLHDRLLAGAAPVQSEELIVLPLLSLQVTVCVCVPPPQVFEHSENPPCTHMALEQAWVLHA